MAEYGANCGVSTNFYQLQSSMLRQGAAITKLGIFAATIIAAAGVASGVKAWGAEIIPTTASPAAAPSTPKPCTGLWDFIDTNCQLTWYGITVYGTIDAGVGWQSHGAPFDPQSAGGASYRIRRMNWLNALGARPHNGDLFDLGPLWSHQSCPDCKWPNLSQCRSIP